MQNPAEPVRFEEESGQQDANEPIQKTDDTDGNKDDNVDNSKSLEGGNTVEIENKENNEEINNRKRKRKEKKRKEEKKK